MRFSPDRRPIVVSKRQGTRRGHRRPSHQTDALRLLHFRDKSAGAQRPSPASCLPPSRVSPDRRRICSSLPPQISLFCSRLLTTNWDKYNGKVDAVFRPARMTAGELEHGAAWFADPFYSLPSIFYRLLVKSGRGPLGGTSLALAGPVLNRVTFRQASHMFGRYARAPWLTSCRVQGATSASLRRYPDSQSDARCQKPQRQPYTLNAICGFSRRARSAAVLASPAER